jgi:hypothetical protein
MTAVHFLHNSSDQMPHPLFPNNLMVPVLHAAPQCQIHDVREKLSHELLSTHLVLFQGLF